MSAKTVTTYVESLYEGPSMMEELERIFLEKRTGSLSVNFICGGIASIKWTEKGTTVRNGNGQGKYYLTEKPQF